MTYCLNRHIPAGHELHMHCNPIWSPLDRQLMTWILLGERTVPFSDERPHHHSVTYVRDVVVGALSLFVREVYMVVECFGHSKLLGQQYDVFDCLPWMDFIIYQFACFEHCLVDHCLHSCSHLPILTRSSFFSDESQNHGQRAFDELRDTLDGHPYVATLDGFRHFRFRRVKNLR